jgi:hypothetical protein
MESIGYFVFFTTWLLDNGNSEQKEVDEIIVVLR